MPSIKLRKINIFGPLLLLFVNMRSKGHRSFRQILQLARFLQHREKHLQIANLFSPESVDEKEIHAN